MWKLERISRTGFIRKLKHVKRKYLVAVSVSAVLLLVGVVTGVVAYNRHQDAERLAAAARASQDTVDQAVAATVTNPNYKAAETALLQQIRATKDGKQKSQLYIDLSSIYLQQQQSAQAAASLEKAAEADSSRADELAVTTADAYNSAGNAPKALGYYKTALDYFKSKPKDYAGRSYYITDIEAKITELQK